MTSGRLGLCPHDTEINMNKIWTYFVENLSICPFLNLNEWQRRSHCPFFVWLSSCEQNSGQTKSDPFPDITKRFKRYQREVNDRESATAINRQKSPASKQRESAQVRKQTKSCSSARGTTQKRSASAQGGEKEPEQHSDVPVCDGKQNNQVNRYRPQPQALAVYWNRWVFLYAIYHYVCDGDETGDEYARRIEDDDYRRWKSQKTQCSDANFIADDRKT